MLFIENIYYVTVSARVCVYTSVCVCVRMYARACVRCSNELRLDTPLRGEKSELVNTSQPCAKDKAEKCL